MKVSIFALASFLCVSLASFSAQAFCGFYVAKADSDLFNKASKVVMVRDQNRTVITMANDYHGDPSEFALVVPTPYVLKREQIHVTENSFIERIDAFTAPRLVEYFDANPCEPVLVELQATNPMAMRGAADRSAARAKALGVTIEASYDVGEYDILILSATQSSGLVQWLKENNYRIPEGAESLVADYLAAGMKFFVAKVDLAEHKKRGHQYLRPLQLAFDSEQFMLPIRLGMLNSQGKQELLLFTITRTGRVETANYRTAAIPSNANIPLFVRDEFGKFYKATFEQAVAREQNPVVMLEYAWNMGFCDPCAADPLTVEELRELGVFWLAKSGVKKRPSVSPFPIAPVEAYVTRLHMLYDKQTFPHDLLLRQTNNSTNFQGRYILNHPYKGEAKCEQGKLYFQSLPKRFEKEAQTLANLTGWDISDIRKRMREDGQTAPAITNPIEEWWKNLWDNTD